MCNASGSVLSSNEVMLLLTPCEESSAEANYIMTEHPVLGTPFVTLHICGMDDVLALLRDGSEDPLILLKWLSVVAPHIGIDLGPKMYGSIATELRRSIRDV